MNNIKSNDQKSKVNESCWLSTQYHETGQTLPMENYIGLFPINASCTMQYFIDKIDQYHLTVWNNCVLKFVRLWKTQVTTNLFVYLTTQIA